MHESPPLRRRDEDVLWRVEVAEDLQRELPGGAYWFDNRVRPEPRVVIQYVVEGSLTYVDDEGWQEVRAGWALLFTHGEPSAYGLPRNASQPLVTSYCSFCGAGLREHWAAMRRRFGSVFYLGSAHPLRWALADLRRYARLEHGPENALRRPLDVFEAASAVHSFVMRLQAYLESRGKETRPPVERAIDDILRNPTFPWSIKEIAARHGCSREHLSRLFSDRVGVSPVTYLLQERTRRAVELLRDSNLTVAEIVTRSGFPSTSALARSVRVETGLSPRALRARAVRERTPPAAGAPARR